MNSISCAVRSSLQDSSTQTSAARPGHRGSSVRSVRIILKSSVFRGLGVDCLSQKMQVARINRKYSRSIMMGGSSGPSWEGAPTARRHAADLFEPWSRVPPSPPSTFRLPEISYSNGFTLYKDGGRFRAPKNEASTPKRPGAMTRDNWDWKKFARHCHRPISSRPATLLRS